MKNTKEGRGQMAVLFLYMVLICSVVFFANMKHFCIQLLYVINSVSIPTNESV